MTCNYLFAAQVSPTRRSTCWSLNDAVVSTVSYVAEDIADSAVGRMASNSNSKREAVSHCTYIILLNFLFLFYILES